MPSSPSVPINVFRSREVSSHKGISLAHVPTPRGELGPFLRAIGAITFDNWKHGQRGIIAHRGYPSVINGVKAPECSVLALQRAYDLGIMMSEIDDAVDASGNIFHFHDKRLERWMLAEGPFDKANISDIPNHNLEYIDREIRDGKFTGEYQRTGQHLLSFDDASDILRRNPGQQVIDDCRDEDPPAIAARISKLPPDVRESRLVQIQSFQIKSAEDFITKVEQNDPAPDWKTTVKIIPIPHPHALHIIAGVHLDQLKFASAVNVNWDWVEGFVKAGLRVVAAVIIRSGAARHYATDDLAYFKGRRITARADLVHFITDKIEEELQLRLHAQYLHIPVLSPSALPTHTENGVHLLSSFHNPLDLVMLDPENNIRDFFFLQAAVPANHYRWGIDFCVCDDVWGAAYALATDSHLSPNTQGT
ncbi:hypothetical protein EYR40_002953 [Pleurotus pulmonarius]|nr:hypothetical protein EYR40_002953 [Pleurotus pulmonarius]